MGEKEEVGKMEGSASLKRERLLTGAKGGISNPRAAATEFQARGLAEAVVTSRGRAAAVFL